jgi:hypothetical protein
MCKFLALAGLVGILASCSSPPEGCSESYSTDHAAHSAAQGRLQQMTSEGLFEFDLGRLKPETRDRIALVLASKPSGKPDSIPDVNVDFIEESARKIKALPTDDKLFFISYHGSETEDKKFKIVQVSVEWKLYQNKSESENESFMKTGYFDSEGNLVCITIHKARTK